jgi:hypothetical protein
VRQIRMLRAMWRELETGLRRLLPGHEGGNPGHGQGAAYGLPRQLSTLPPRRSTSSCCLSRRFSAMTARTPPGPHSFAVTTARCSSPSQAFITWRKRRAGARCHAMLSNLAFGARITNSRPTECVRDSECRETQSRVTKEGYREERRPLQSSPPTTQLGPGTWYSPRRLRNPVADWRGRHGRGLPGD